MWEWDFLLTWEEKPKEGGKIKMLLENLEN